MHISLIECVPHTNNNKHLLLGYDEANDEAYDEANDMSYHHDCHHGVFSMILYHIIIIRQIKPMVIGVWKLSLL